MSRENPVILAVDDDVSNFCIIEEFLSGKGYEIRTATNGEQALEILHWGNVAVDVILLDRMMPGIDGLNVLKLIRQDPDLETIPIVMLTASGKPEQIAEGIKAGCYYYLTKPFERLVLCEVVSAALRDHANRIAIQVGMQKFKKAIEEERSKTHQATLRATYHYLNNSLNQFQLVLLELETKGSIDPSILLEIKNSINKTAADMREFGLLENPTRENVEKFINDHL